MTVKLEFETTVLPGNRVEVCSPRLPEGKPAKVVVTVEEPQPTLVVQVEPDLAEAERLYYRDLPQLLQTKPGRWVAYSREGCVGEGDDPAALYTQCYRRGLERGHFVVTRVQPDLPTAEVSDSWFPFEEP